MADACQTAQACDSVVAQALHWMANLQLDSLLKAVNGYSVINQ